MNTVEECYLLYGWDYNDDTDSDTGFQIKYEDDLTDNKEPKQGRIRRRLKELPSLTSEELSHLSPEEALSRRQRLLGLYSTLKSYPELMDRRLLVGSTKPEIPAHVHGKRSFNHLTSSPSCPAKTEWQLLTSARTFNDTQVDVFQPSDGTIGHQWFYTSTCETDDASYVPEDATCRQCCRGISRNSYHSKCMTRKTFVMALVRETPSEAYDWDWIQINAGCTCFISPV
ncbi:uncharacterized protein [Littorina saxatilis]|uniref:uncharacterized protein n=1 Tax=Littorina saxatilis TaxID=31220 RepID=UPI0038B4C365